MGLPRFMSSGVGWSVIAVSRWVSVRGNSTGAGPGPAPTSGLPQVTEPRTTPSWPILGPPIRANPGESGRFGPDRGPIRRPSARAARLGIEAWSVCFVECGWGNRAAAESKTTRNVRRPARWRPTIEETPRPEVCRGFPHSGWCVSRIRRPSQQEVSAQPGAACVSAMAAELRSNGAARRRVPCLSLSGWKTSPDPETGSAKAVDLATPIHRGRPRPTRSRHPTQHPPRTWSCARPCPWRDSATRSLCTPYPRRCWQYP